MTTPLTRIRDRLRDRVAREVDAPEAREAAVAVIVVPAGDDVEVLFIRRARRSGDPWSGQMALPGGRREPDDRDLLHTALRETAEEIAVRLTPAVLLGQLDDLHPQIAALPSIVVRPFVFGLDHRPAITPNAEVAGHRWETVTRLRAAHGLHTVEVRGVPRTVDAYVLDEDVVWGMTHRLLAPFMALMR